MESPEEARRRECVVGVAGTSEVRKTSERKSLGGCGRMRRNLMQVRDGVSGGLGHKMEE